MREHDTPIPAGRQSARVNLHRIEREKIRECGRALTPAQLIAANTACEHLAYICQDAEQRRRASDMGIGQP